MGGFNPKIMPFGFLFFSCFHKGFIKLGPNIFPAYYIITALENIPQSHFSLLKLMICNSPLMRTKRASFCVYLLVLFSPWCLYVSFGAACSMQVEAGWRERYCYSSVSGVKFCICHLINVYTITILLCYFGQVLPKVVVFELWLVWTLFHRPVIERLSAETIVCSAWRHSKVYLILI